MTISERLNTAPNDNDPDCEYSILSWHMEKAGDGKK